MIAIRTEIQFSLYPLAGLFALACLVTWDFPSAGYYITPSALDREMGLAPIAPPNTLTFILLSTLALVFFTAVGLWQALRNVRSPGQWASLSVAVALLTLANGFVRIQGFDTSLSWGGISLFVAIGLLFGANVLRRHAGVPQHDPALAAFAVGVLGAVALAFTMTLEKAWLSVALAALIPGLAWIYQRVEVNMLRRVALVLSFVVFARLILNPFALEYTIEAPIWLNWMIYGFGLPAIAFYFAGKWFGESKKDLTTHVLEAGALVFLIALLVSQVRLHIHGGVITSPRYLLSEASFNTLIWFGLAYGFARSSIIETSRIAQYSVRILFALASGHLIWFHLFMLNPLDTNEAVGDLFLFNILGLAYLAPIGFLGLFLLSDKKRSCRDIFTPKRPGCSPCLPMS